ncbi:hypothetical protein AVEN_112164-1 [Araneus ventricosus]|uniref:Uncharacterized protein n=1 Tax=Araneus ventricosus TaxID=182803 RepID=A0A4Y2S8U0_ARAVE|nr:hypothetical protein AVEN_112164-1 [Araneus ventricosus]
MPIQSEFYAYQTDMYGAERAHPSTRVSVRLPALLTLQHPGLSRDSVDRHPSRRERGSCSPGRRLLRSSPRLTRWKVKNLLHENRMNLSDILCRNRSVGGDIYICPRPVLGWVSMVWGNFAPH